MADPIPADADPVQVAEAHRAIQVIRLIADDQVGEAFDILQAEFPTRAHAFRIGWTCANFVTVHMAAGWTPARVAAEAAGAGQDIGPDAVEALTATLAATVTDDVVGCHELWMRADIDTVDELISLLLGLAGRLLRDHIAAERARSN